MERPAEATGREFLTDEEVAALERQAESRFSTAIENSAGITLGGDRAERGTTRDVAQAYSPVFISVGTRYVRTKRTSLVIDPPDGKIPYSAAGREKVAAEAAYRKALAASDSSSTLSDREMSEQAGFPNVFRRVGGAPRKM